jgi:Ca2+-binding RTX toxin-like protein
MDAGADQIADEGSVVSLTGAIFSDLGILDTHAATIEWGDGSPPVEGLVDQTLRTVYGTHVYADNGVYTVLVTITDDDGASASDSFEVTVHNVAPVITSLGIEPALGVPGVPLTLSCGFTDPGTGDTCTATVDWGDGTIDEITGMQATDLFVIDHTYYAGSVFDLVVTVTDDDGGFDQAAREVMVTGVAVKDGVLYIAGTAGDDTVYVSKPVEPIGWWRFDETSGPTAADSAGDPQDGTYFGRWLDLDDAGPDVAFDSGTSTEFHNRSSEYVAVAHDAVFEVAGGTIQLWFNTDSTCGRQTLFSKDHYGFGEGGHLNIALDGAWLEVRLQSPEASYYVRADKPVAQDAWYHLAFSFGPQGMKLYLDGELVGENAYTGGLAGNQEPIVIGGSLIWNRCDGDDLERLKVKESFDGHIDEVAFFGDELSAEQIRQLLDRGPAAVTSQDGPVVRVYADFLEDPGHIRTFAADNIYQGIKVYLGAGDDEAAIDGYIDLPLFMDGSEGDDRLTAGAGPAEMYGRDGDDILAGGPAGDLLDGGEGDDLLEGGPGDDILLGGAGDDHLIGGPGDDILDGGPGYDIVSGERILPVAYWSFNETGGWVIADSAGEPQDGTFFGSHPDLDDPGPPESVAPFGAETGAHFHRWINEYVAVAHDEAFEVPEGTVALWFQVDCTRETLFSKDHLGYGDGGHLNIAVVGARLEVRLQSEEDSYYILTGDLVQSGQWYHLAFTFGSAGMKLYLDGKLVGENAYTGGLAENQEPIVIGGSLEWNSYDGDDFRKLQVREPFDGHIDEVAFYALALSAGQIQQLMLYGPLGAGGGMSPAGYSGALGDYLVGFEEGALAVADTRPASPVAIAYWSLNETGGWVVADSAGEPQDGTFFGSHPDLDDPGPPESVAPFGSETAADFHHSSNDYIAIAHDEAFEVSEGTVQLWFNADRTWGEQGLLSKDHLSYGDGGHLDIALDGSRLEARLQSAEQSYTIRTEPLIEKNTWYQVTFTFGPEGMRLYLDGELVGENPYTGGLEGNRQPLVIGGSLEWNNYCGDDLRKLQVRESFDGHIDEVAFYGEALTVEQIQQSMSEGPLGVRSAHETGTIDGTDRLVGAELLVFGDGGIVYVLGAGSENPGQLSAAEVQELAGAGPLVILGPEGEPLSLEGAWINRGEEIIGETAYVRWVHGTSQAVVLALAGVEVAPEEELAPILPVAHFPGSSKECIAVPHDQALELEEGTVALWFQADSIYGRQTLLSKDGCGYGNGGHLDISLVGGRIEVRLQSANDSYYIQTGKLVKRGEPVHLAFTFGSQGMKLYLDGELVGENPYTGGLEGNREPLVIGGSIWANGKIHDSFDGRIDEAAIFGVALDGDQIEQLIAAGCP